MKNKGFSIPLVIIIIALVVIIGIVAIFIVSGNKNNENGNSTTNNANTGRNIQSQNNVAGNTQNNVTNNNQSSTTSKIQYWVKTKNWTNGLDSISIYKSNVVAPFKLEDYGDSTINSFINSTDTITPGSSKYKNLYKHKGDTISGDIRVYNLSQNNMSIAECYKKGWWSIYSNSNIIANSDRSDSRKNIVDVIADSLGKPDYILLYNAIPNAYEMYQNDNGTIAYDLVYKKNNYVITVTVTDVILTNSKTGIASSETIDFSAMTYYNGIEAYENYEKAEESKVIKIAL